MKFLTIPGIDQKCSQLIMGSMTFSIANYKHSEEMLNKFIELGGNAIDLAHIYGGGESEKAVGRWLQGVDRSKLMLIDKGGHHDAAGPRITRSAISSDLHESLERLQCKYIDVYLLHRDNPDLPAGEIIQILNEHIDRGTIGAIGASNWTVQRIQEANEFAEAHGLQGFSCSSPNLSLAKANEPRWAGCISVNDADLHWHTNTQLPLLSWSSQAMGFFTGRYSAENREYEEIVRVYYNERNWERLRRAEQLAEQKGTNANAIALSYVLNQPFPTAAIIGPQQISEFKSSFEAVHVELNPAEIKWLNLED